MNMALTKPILILVFVSLGLGLDLGSRQPANARRKTEQITTHKATIFKA